MIPLPSPSTGCPLSGHAEILLELPVDKSAAQLRTAYHLVGSVHRDLVSASSLHILVTQPIACLQKRAVRRTIHLSIGHLMISLVVPEAEL